MDLLANMKSFFNEIKNEINEAYTDQKNQAFNATVQSWPQKQVAKPAQPIKQKAQKVIAPKAQPQYSEEGRPDDPSLIYADEIGKEEHLLTIDHTSVLNGIIFSEILGKPKSRRAGR